MIYYIETRSQLLDIERRIKGNTTDDVITVAILKSAEIKSFTWFLLKKDIEYTKTSPGAGIIVFNIDIPDRKSNQDD